MINYCLKNALISNKVLWSCYEGMLQSFQKILTIAIKILSIGIYGLYIAFYTLLLFYMAVWILDARKVEIPITY